MAEPSLTTITNVLNKAIKNFQSLAELSSLLKIKETLPNTKIDFIVKEEIFEKQSLSLILKLLESLLDVVLDIEQQIREIFKFLNKKVNELFSNPNESSVESDKLAVLNIYHLVLSFSPKLAILKSIEHLELMHNLMAKIEGQSQDVSNLFALRILQHYFTIFPVTEQVLLINKLFEICKRKDNLLLLCCVFDSIKIECFLNKSSVFYNEHFWLFLNKALSYEIIDLNNQANYLLEKSVDLIYKENLLDITFISLNVNKQSWDNFFTLLDISKEKQLHLIKPSLKLLPSIDPLHFIWQLIILKKLLNHSQNEIAFETAIYTFNKRKEPVEKFIEIALPALNRNDFLFVKKKALQQFESFANTLDNLSLNKLIYTILNIKWNPSNIALIFCLYNSWINRLFSEKSSSSLLELILRFVKKLPHLYFRNCCIKSTIKHYLDNINFAFSKDYLEGFKIAFEYDQIYVKNYKMNEQNIIFILDIFKNKNKFDFNLKDCLLFSLIYTDGPEKFLLAKEIDNLDIASKISLMSQIKLNNFEIDFESFLKNVDQLSFSEIDALLEVVQKPRSVWVKEILDKPEDHTEQELYLSLKLFCDNTIDINDFCKTKLLSNYKMDENISSALLELYFSKMETSKIDFDFLKHLFDNHTAKVHLIIFKNLYRFFETLSETKQLELEKICFEYLKTNIKERHFERAFGLFLKIFIKPNTYNEYLENSLNHFLNFIEIYYFIGQYIILHLSTYSENFQFLKRFLPCLKSIYLSGIITLKEDRIDYEIHSLLIKPFGKGIDIYKTNTKIICLDLILKLRKYEGFADDFTDILLEAYMKSYNKRYFPDSQVHVEKLRIVQALIIVEPFVRKVDGLVEFLLESFCSEIHQISVKQLMQFLLIKLLLKKDQKESLKLIERRVEAAVKTQPSTIAAFIPVLFHLALNGEEEFWVPSLELLITWSMGAHFKLRILSQIAACELFQEAGKRNYDMEKAKIVLKPLQKTVLMSKEASSDVLKTDLGFIKHLNIGSVCPFQTALIDIPKYNKVIESEWNIDWNNSSFSIDNTFSNFAKSFEENKNDPEEIHFNVQKKLTPWKTLFGDELNTNEFVLIATLIDKANNLGGLSRTCEAFGIQKLIVNDGKIVENKDFKSLSMSSENWLQIAEVKLEGLKSFLIELKDKGFVILGAEQTSESIGLDKFEFPKRTALLLGNEKSGIPSNLLCFLDKCIEIPQFGMVRSLNVHVAGATFIWEYIKQHYVKK